MEGRACSSENLKMTPKRYLSPVQVDVATTYYYPVPYQMLISNRNCKFESADRQDSKSFD